jgi:hypothetical protein
MNAISRVEYRVRWVDLSRSQTLETVKVLNQSVTGYSPRRNVLRLSAYRRNRVGIQTFEAG